MAAAYQGGGATAITTELIQKYLDENKQLILAILDNQNLGKLNECAQYQMKLQQNLMYLAAIADAQPQPPMAAPQVPASMMQSQQHYMQQQQQQHMLQQQQAMLGQRNQTLQYMHHQQQQQQHQAAAAAAAAAAMQQQQQQHPMAAAINGGIHNILGSSDASGNNGGGPSFADFGRPSAAAASEHALQTSIGLGGAPPSAGDASGHAGDDSEASYLKASEEDGN